MRVETEVAEDILTPEEKLNGLLGEDGLSGNTFRFMNVTVDIDAPYPLRGAPNAYLFLSATKGVDQDRVFLFRMKDGLKMGQRDAWAAIYGVPYNQAATGLFVDRQMAREWLQSKAREENPNAEFFYAQLDAKMVLPGVIDGQAMPGPGSMKSFGGRVTQ